MSKEKSVRQNIAEGLSGPTENTETFSLANVEPIYISKDDWAKISVLEGDDRKSWKEEHGISSMKTVRVDLYSEDENGESVVEAFMVDNDNDFGTILELDSERLNNELLHKHKIIDQVGETAVESSVAELNNVGTQNDSDKEQKKVEDQFYREFDGSSRKAIKHVDEATQCVNLAVNKISQQVNAEFNKIHTDSSMPLGDRINRLRILAESIPGIRRAISEADNPINDASSYIEHTYNVSSQAFHLIEDDKVKSTVETVAQISHNTHLESIRLKAVHERVQALLRTLDDGLQYAAYGRQDNPRYIEGLLEQMVPTMRQLHTESTDLIGNLESIHGTLMRLRNDIEVENH